LESGKHTNTTKSVGKDIPMEDFKATQTKIEKDEGLTDSLEGGTSSETRGSDLHNSQPEPRRNGNINHILDDEITISPVQERSPSRDIRFGDLPHPRIPKRENDEGTVLSRQEI
jgi:hypothetical protein